jgi:hypothetical protein
LDLMNTIRTEHEKDLHFRVILDVHCYSTGMAKSKLHYPGSIRTNKTHSIL